MLISVLDTIGPSHINNHEFKFIQLTENLKTITEQKPKSKNQ